MADGSEAGNDAQAYTALLLCGGRSSRMKQDKSFLVHPQSSLPLFQHLLENVLTPLSLPGGIIISSRDDEQARKIGDVLSTAPAEAYSSVEVLVDDRASLGDIGPASGLLTAHLRYPNKTFVVLAVDFPQASTEGVSELIAGHEVRAGQRGKTVVSPVTCFLHPEDNHPEPLMSIWTPVALKRLHENATQKGKSGPCFSAKQLWKELLDDGTGMAEGAGLVRPSKPEWVADTDTPEEWEKVFGARPSSWSGDKQ